MAKKKFYRPILYWLLLGVRGLFMLLPLRWGMAFAGFVGSSTFYLVPREREKTLAHLRLGFPEKTESELRAIALRMFRNYGYTLAELALLDKIIPQFERLIRVTGREHFDDALKAGNGIAAIGAHFANWEMMAGYLAYLGYPNTVVARRIYYDGYDKLLLSARQKMKLRTIDRDKAAREVLKAFQSNQVVGFVADQDVASVDGVFVQFFGRPAFSPSAPVRFALKAGAPVIPIFMIREGMDYHIIIEAPIELVNTGDKEQDMVANTQKWVALQERYIRQYPHLWVWNHKRWKTPQNRPTLSQI
jgi:Kdo2-lipid IVA lauroyltransferase/acyltransferase